VEKHFFEIKKIPEFIILYNLKTITYQGKGGIMSVDSIYNDRSLKQLVIVLLRLDRGIDRTIQ